MSNSLRTLNNLENEIHIAINYMIFRVYKEKISVCIIHPYIQLEHHHGKVFGHMNYTHYAQNCKSVNYH